MDKKRILLIALFILATILITFALYYVFWRVPTAPTNIITNAPTNALPGGLPSAINGVPPGLVGNVPTTITPLPQASTIARGGITQTTVLNDTVTVSPSLTADGKNLNFYSPTDGKFYRVTPDGKSELLSDKTFYDVQKITWAPQSDKAILEYPDGSKTFYDFNQGKQATLPKHWEGFSFSNQGDRIAAKSIAIDPNNRWLIISNPDGTNAQTVLPMGKNQDKVQVTWSPNNSVMAFSDTGAPQGFGRKQIIPIGTDGETFNPLIIEGFEFIPKWSKDGNRLIYSTYNTDSDYKPTIWITNSGGADMGTGRHKLELNTWADKCTFATNDVVYCAVPEELQEGVGLVRALANNSVDDLYKIDLNTNLKTLVAKPETNFSMTNLIVSEDGTNLFFTDVNSGQLQKIKLK